MFSRRSLRLAINTHGVVRIRQLGPHFQYSEILLEGLRLIKEVKGCQSTQQTPVGNLRSAQRWTDMASVNGRSRFTQLPSGTALFSGLELSKCTDPFDEPE
jgi:hypothetical protein